MTDDNRAANRQYEDAQIKEQVTRSDHESVFQSAVDASMNQPPTVYDSEHDAAPIEEPTVDMLPPADD